MNIHQYIIIIVVALSLASCEQQNNVKSALDITEIDSTNIQLDHFNIWVVNPQKAKKRLTDIGFNSVSDSLSETHFGQGTTGRYFYFLNTYLELIFVYDQKEFEENVERNTELDFLERANFEQNRASPFSIALNLKDYIIDNIPFEKIRYQ